MLLWRCNIQIYIGGNTVYKFHTVDLDFSTAVLNQSEKESGRKPIGFYAIVIFLTRQCPENVLIVFFFS